MLRVLGLSLEFGSIFKVYYVISNQINIYELISVCSCPGMISKTAYSSQTKLIGLNLHVSEHGIGYSNLTLDPLGLRGPRGSKFMFHQIKKLR